MRTSRGGRHRPPPAATGRAGLPRGVRRSPHCGCRACCNTRCAAARQFCSPLYTTAQGTSARSRLPFRLTTTHCERQDMTDSGTSRIEQPVNSRSSGTMTVAEAMFTYWTNSVLARRVVLHRLVKQKVRSQRTNKVSRLSRRESIRRLLLRRRLAVHWYHSEEPDVLDSRDVFRRLLLCGETPRTMLRFCGNPWICPICRAATLLRTIRKFQQRIEAQRKRDPFSAGMQLICTRYTTTVPIEELPEAFIVLAQRPPAIGRKALRAPGRAGLTITVPALNNSQPMSKRTEIYLCDSDDTPKLPYVPHWEHYSPESTGIGRLVSRRTEIQLCDIDTGSQAQNGSFLIRRYSPQLLANILADTFAYSPGLFSSRDLVAKTAVWNAILRLKRGDDGERFKLHRCQSYGWIRGRQLDEQGSSSDRGQQIRARAID